MTTAPTQPDQTTTMRDADAHLKPGGPGPTAAAPNPEDVFLSPRVMDAGAFARYSEMLKSIIEQATRQGRTLEDFSTDAEEMIRRATDTEQTLDKRLQAGMRLVKLIDERSERAEQAQARLDEAMPDADELQRRLEQSIAETIDRATARVQQHAADAERRAEEATARAEQAAERLGALESRLADAQRRADETAQTLESAADRVGPEIDARLAHTFDACEQRARSLDDRFGALDQQITAIRGTADDALRALGLDPENPRLEDAPIARIESLVERGETHIAGADRLFRQLEELHNQAESVKHDFGAWLLDAATKVDELESRRDALEGPIVDAAKAVEGCTPELEARVERAQRSLDELRAHADALQSSVEDAATTAEGARGELVNQSAQLQALLDGSLNRLTERVEQAGQWLGSLIARARESGEALGHDPNIPIQEPPREPPQNPPLARPHPEPKPAPQHPPQSQPQHEPGPGPAARPTTTGATESPGASAPPPVPERLPIDTLSFDGAADVHTHPDNDSAPDDGPDDAPGAGGAD